MLEPLMDVVDKRRARLEWGTTAPGGGDLELVDRFMSDLGLPPLGPDWRALEPQVARAAVRALAELDIAYRTPILTADEADELALEFFAQLSAQARFLTNGDLAVAVAEGRRQSSWVPLTGATFDTGVVAIDGTRVGLIWFADEP
jgi:hypothetical protein